MILYNETINVENGVREEWLEWIRAVYIPKVLETKAFMDFKLFRLINEEDNEGTTYCIQFFANTMWDVEDYNQNYSYDLQTEHYLKFRDKFVIFSTILESV